MLPRKQAVASLFEALVGGSSPMDASQRMRVRGACRCRRTPSLRDPLQPQSLGHGTHRSVAGVGVDERCPARSPAEWCGVSRVLAGDVDGVRPGLLDASSAMFWLSARRFGGHCGGCFRRSGSCANPRHVPMCRNMSIDGPMQQVPPLEVVGHRHGHSNTADRHGKVQLCSHRGLAGARAHNIGFASQKLPKPRSPCCSLAARRPTVGGALAGCLLNPSMGGTGCGMKGRSASGLSLLVVARSQHALLIEMCRAREEANLQEPQGELE